MKASIEDVPDWRVKTPLQIAVQILKRHRDIYFHNKRDVKPVSIILTTLAAHSYENQDDIYDALTGIAKRMPSFIESRNGNWWVQSPVDSDENFVDKWNEYAERHEAFMQWLNKVENDFAKVSTANTVNDGLLGLEESLGQETMTKVAEALGEKRRSPPAIHASSLSLVPALGDAVHAQDPQWPVVQKYDVRLLGGVYFKKGTKRGRLLWPLSGKPVPKNVWLRFTAKTNVPEPYSIRWQVVNTGQEAVQAGQPRGDFYEADDSDKRVRWESTAYRGTHWVEAFILQGGVCVGRSGKFYVKVR